MGAFKLIARNGELFRDFERYAIVHKDHVLVRVKYALLTDIDYLALTLKKHTVLGTLALGKIVERGTEVPKNVLGKTVVLGPKCLSRIYVRDLEGLASSYVAVPVNCVKETSFNNPYILLAPCFKELLHYGNLKYVLEGGSAVWGFNPTPILEEKIRTYVCCLDFYEKLDIDEEILSEVEEYFRTCFFKIEENLVELKKALMKSIVFVIF